jgi:Domain of unknown function (DUF4279)
MNREPEKPFVDAWKEVRCSISIASDTLTPKEVTTSVGVEPTKQRVKGEPISAERPNTLVASHLWVWEPDDSVDRSLDAQLDAIWLALGPRASRFKDLPAEVMVRVSIWITHYGKELSLGWALNQRHVGRAAAFGASLDIDEYDETGDENINDEYDQTDEAEG